jgi:hypothetical protein
MKRKQPSSSTTTIVNKKKKIDNLIEDETTLKSINQLPNDTLIHTFTFIDSFGLYSNVNRVCKKWRTCSLHSYIINCHYQYMFSYSSKLSLNQLENNEKLECIHIALSNGIDSVSKQLSDLDKLMNTFQIQYESIETVNNGLVPLRISEMYDSFDLNNRLTNIVKKRLDLIQYRRQLLLSIAEFSAQGRSYYFTNMKDYDIFSYLLENTNRVLVKDYKYTPSRWSGNSNLATPDIFHSEVMFMSKIPGNQSRVVSLELFDIVEDVSDIVARLTLHIDGYMIAHFSIEDGEKKFQIYEVNIQYFTMSLLGEDGLNVNNRAVLQFLLTTMLPQKAEYPAITFFKSGILQLVGKLEQYLIKPEETGIPVKPEQLPQQDIAEDSSDSDSDSDLELEEEVENSSTDEEAELEQKLSVIKRADTNTIRTYSKTGLRSRDKINKFSKY